jgi:hypothetical protein
MVTVTAGGTGQLRLGEFGLRVCHLLLQLLCLLHHLLQVGLSTGAHGTLLSSVRRHAQTSPRTGTHDRGVPAPGIRVRR